MRPSTAIHNLMGAPGAIAADIAMQSMGLSCVVALTPPAFWGWRLMTRRRLERARLRLVLWLVGSTAAAGLASFLPAPDRWPLPTGLGGVLGDAVLWLPRYFFAGSTSGMVISGLALAGVAILTLTAAAGFGLMHAPSFDEIDAKARPHALGARAGRGARRQRRRGFRRRTRLRSGLARRGDPRHAHGQERDPTLVRARRGVRRPGGRAGARALARSARRPTFSLGRGRCVAPPRPARRVEPTFSPAAPAPHGADAQAWRSGDAGAAAAASRVARAGRAP